MNRRVLRKRRRVRFAVRCDSIRQCRSEGGRYRGSFRNRKFDFIDGIRNDDVDRRRSVLDDFGDDALRDVDVRLRQIQPRLSRFPCDARCQNDDIGIFCIGVCPCIDGYGIAERRTLTDVERFAQGFLRVDIDHHDFRSYAFYGERIRDRRADLTGPDDCDFECQFLFLCTATLLQQVLYGDCSLLCRRHIHKKNNKALFRKCKAKKLTKIPRKTGEGQGAVNNSGSRLGKRAVFACIGRNGCFCNFRGNRIDTVFSGDVVV